MNTHTKKHGRLHMAIFLLLALGILPAVFQLSPKADMWDGATAVATELELTAALADGVVSVIEIKNDIALSGALTVSRSVALVGENVALTAAAGNRHIFVNAKDTALTFDGVTLDGGSNGGGIAYSNAINDTEPGGVSVITGANIVNCRWPAADLDKGGAVYSGFGNFHNLKLVDCEITENYAGSNGGGVFGNADVTLENCIVSNNTSTEQGGGVYALWDISVSGSVISGNTLTGGGTFGGGMDSGNGDVTVSSSTLSENTAKRGGAICAERGDVFIGSDVTVENNTVTTTDNAAVYAGKALTVDDGTTTVADSPNILFVNNGGYACQGVTGVNVNGNVTFRNNAEGAARYDVGTVVFTGNVVAEGHLRRVFWANAVDITGGALRNNGSANLANTPVAINGMFQGETMTAENCEISGNIYSGYGTIAFLTHGVTLEKCNVFDNQNLNTWEGNYSALIYLRDVRFGPGTVTLINSTFSDNYSMLHGVFRSFGDVTIDGCTFTANRADNFGAAFVAFGNNNESTRISVKNTKFDGNTAGWYGVAVLGRNSTIENCVFINNESENSGGALFIRSGSQTDPVTVISDSEFTSNKAGSLGGAIYTRSDYIAFTNCVFDGNEAECGGAIFFKEEGETSDIGKLDKCVFRNNSADYGGALYYGARGAQTIVDSVISGNSAGDWGGGILIGESLANGALIELNIENTEISGNSAVRGGGVYSWTPNDTTCEITVGAGSVISGNRALLPVDVLDYEGPGRGGGVYLESNSSLALTGAAVRGNTAATDGGGVYAEDLSKLTASSAAFSQNSAPVTYLWALPDEFEELHGTNIKNTTFTVPFTRAYNNADVNYTPDGVSITYDPGYGAQPRSVIKAGPYNVSDVVTLTTAGQLGWQRSGYTFSGWSLTENGELASNTLQIGPDGHYYYAVWAQNGPYPTGTPTPTPTPTPEPSPTPEDPEPTPEPTPPPEEPTPTPTPEDPEPEPQPELPPDRPGVIIVPGTPDVPPAPANPGSSLVPELNDDGEEILLEIGEDGVPLGEWHYEPVEEVWIYEPYTPMAEVPPTGDGGAYIAAALFAVSAMAFMALVKAGKKRA
ncbi:MAG: hypothetical protein LBS51_08625 [Oscillospiraceae bacterium]|jgi:predicted outer membrane repeat protein|nr:hypothetical protein [Oscillospiraceae bacterium]